MDAHHAVITPASLEALAARGIRLIRTGSALHWDVPAAWITPVLLAELEVLKAALETEEQGLGVAVSALEVEGSEVAQAEPAVPVDRTDPSDPSDLSDPASSPTPSPPPEDGGPHPLWVRWETIAHMPVEEQLVALGLLRCGTCGRWLVARHLAPDADGVPRCTDHADCRDAAARCREAWGP
jgi:hypothetical protein